MDVTDKWCEAAFEQGKMLLGVDAGKQVALNGLAAWLIDLQGLFCPEPLMMLRQAMVNAVVGDILVVYATDFSTTRDFARYCRFSGQGLVYTSTEPDLHYFVIKKLV